MRTERPDTIARRLLSQVRLDYLLDGHGRPTDECWDRLETLSGGERVVVEVALAIIDYGTGHKAVSIARLMVLDNANLRAVGEALIAMAGAR